MLRRLLTFVVALAMLAVIPATPTAAAQESSPLPSAAEQQQAAQAVLDQLDSRFAPLSIQDLLIDPALGPPPWTSFVPNRDPLTITAWNAIANRFGQASPVARADNLNGFGLPTGPIIEDIEAPGELGLNDDLASGQLIPTFGTGPDEDAFVRILGTFGGIPQGPPVDCPSVEDDGSIPDANATPLDLTGQPVVFCAGVLGDGPFGETSGDVDFFTLNEVAAGTTIIMDSGSFDPDAVFAVTLGVYTSAGELVASYDDSSSGQGDALFVTAPADDTYFGAIAGVGTLPTDPFDPSSGTGVSFTGEYSFFGVLQPPAPAPPGFSEYSLFSKQARTDPTSLIAGMELPCVSMEDDGAIQLATPVVVEPGTPVECSGAIGDGPFGETTGDFDFYQVDAVQGELLSASTEAASLGDLDTLIVIATPTGEILGGNDNTDDTDSAIQVPVPADGTYVIGVFGADSLPTDPFNSGSGVAAGSTGPYTLTVARDAAPPATDTDVYLFDVEPGDVISAGFGAQPGTFVSIIDPTGRLGQRSGGNPTFIYPLENPLRHIGNVGMDFVVEVPGIHAMVLSDGAGAYAGELRVKRAGLTDTTGDDAQILFLDFDGGFFNDAIFNPFVPLSKGEGRLLSPLVEWLPRWGLDASDEDAVIESIIAEVTDDLIRDLQEAGVNGNRDATGIGGELDLRVLNSRDHNDPWGEPNVSRIIIGGSVEESGIGTIGIAQSIDPGNFDTTETAIVLLDILSGPPDPMSSTLNNFPVAPPFTKVDLVGRGVGNIVAHEAGHFIGNWHTTNENAVPTIMDEGGNLPGTVGVGPDFIFGTADDDDNDFRIDEYSRREPFEGIENTIVRSAQAFSTGQASVVPFFEGLPADGAYTLQNVRSGNFLDADPNGDVNSSVVPRFDDTWELTNIGDDVYNLRKLAVPGYLDADPSRKVNLSNRPASDDRWKMIPVDNGSFYLFNLDYELFLSQVGREVMLTGDETAAERWALGDPVMTNPFVGSSVTIQSAFIGRYLDGDRDGSVDQSARVRADDIWIVSDAGSGYVYLQNSDSGWYLDAADDRSVGTSTTRGSTNRWAITEGDRGTLIRNVDFNRYLTAQRQASGYGVTTSFGIGADAAWIIDDSIANPE